MKTDDHPRGLREKGEFKPREFYDIIRHLPENCPMIGGQAVAWWADRYGLKIRGENGRQTEITSSDIDFWGNRSDLIELAQRTGKQPIFPHPYEMTVWSGAIPLHLRDIRTWVEMLHTVPGLDTNDPEAASAEQQFSAGGVSKAILVLTPISLVLVKAHALKNFDQNARQDFQHLKISIESSIRFIEELLENEAIKLMLWNCKRLIEAHKVKSNRRLEDQYGFNLLDSIPIETIKRAAINPDLSGEKRKRLDNFCNIQWARLKA